MATTFGAGLKADASIPSPWSEAVANELQELSLQPAPRLLPVKQMSVLKLKLQQRRSREELVNQGIMPPLKSSAAFHEQRRNLERARTEDYLKRKIRSRPERSELIRMHILEESSVEPSLQTKQLQLKRSRLADDLNDRIAHRPGPMELIHKNILPVHSSIKQAIVEAQFPKASGNNSSCDEDSSYSLSPEQPGNQESPLGLLPLSSPAEMLAGGSIPSPTQVLPPLPHLQPNCGSSPLLKMTNGTEVTSTQRTSMMAQFKGKPNAERSAQRHRKPKDNKPKIKKLKYHQYIPPDQKGDKEPPPQLDSSYAKILQQQQHFLQLQILNQQQPHYSYHTILPAPPSRGQAEHQPSSSSSSDPAAPSTPGSQVCQSTAPAGGTKPTSLPPKLDEMKVPELKSELKLRSLPVSGTKNDLIERLRTYQELNGGGDTTSGPTAGGTAEPGADGAGLISKTSATVSHDSTSHQQQQQQQQQQQLQCQLMSSLSTQSADGGSSATPQQLLSPSNFSTAAVKSEDTGYCSDNLAEMLSLQPCSDTLLPVTIKEEPKCSTQAPCQFSLKAASLQRRCSLASSASTTTTAAPAAAADKDKMLQEKDKQIEELTSLLRQKQRLVELLRMQLEHRKTGGRVPEALVLVRVKQEPPDKPSEPPSVHLPEPHRASSIPSEIDACDVKQKAIEVDEPETTMRFPDARVLQQTSTQTRGLQIKAGQTTAQTKQQNICLQQTTLQFAQQQAIQKLLLQQQKNMQQTAESQGQTLENQQKLSRQKKKKTPKQPLRQQQQHQQERLQQQSPLSQQQTKQQPTKQVQQIQTKMQLMQQQVPLQQKQQAQQQSPQVSQRYLNQQSGSASSFPADLLKSNSTPALVTDHNGNHFLIALTGHVTENRGADAAQSKAAKHITLQRLQSTPARLPGHRYTQLPKADHQTSQSTHVELLKQQKAQPSNGTVQVCMDQPQQQVSQCLSAPPTLQPFFPDQETAPSGINSSTPSSQTDGEHEDDFIDIVLQRGAMSTTFKPAPDSSLDLLNPNSSSASSSPTSPPQLLFTASPSMAPSMTDIMEEKPRGGDLECGRLEDFLESTTGKPLLGVEPGGTLTLIDDLHSQMLCTPSILDHPPSPMDTFDMAEHGEHGLDGMDWLDLSMGEDFCMRGEETPTLAPLGPHTPPSVFSTDFLDNYDIEAHWDSCL